MFKKKVVSQLVRAGRVAVSNSFYCDGPIRRDCFWQTKDETRKKQTGLACFDT